MSPSNSKDPLDLFEQPFQLGPHPRRQAAGFADHDPMATVAVYFDGRDPGTAGLADNRDPPVLRV
jgi:hypothetical protein